MTVDASPLAAAGAAAAAAGALQSVACSFDIGVVRLARYGKTSSGKYVDMHHLEFLVSMGKERDLAAEALRQVRPVR